MAGVGELPYLTAELPGVGGRIKTTVEDFEVEEIPAYEPSGAGEHLYVWIEKRGMGAEYLTRELARRWRLAPGAIGMAGLKDRQAVTRQWISLPASVEPLVEGLDLEGVRVLRTARHGNKLRPGHLRGNRFRIRLRAVETDARPRAEAILERLATLGLPNFYGPQRFGRGGETSTLGFALLRRERGAPRSPFLRKLALSAAQSALFNDYLAERLRDGWFRTVLPGDVMGKWPAGGMFVARDLPVEQARFEARETVPLGPIFGKKTFPAEGQARERELALLARHELSEAIFAGFGKLLSGTRRHILVYPDELAIAADPLGLVLTVALPAGSYATVLLRELMKCPLESDEPAELAE